MDRCAPAVSLCGMGKDFDTAEDGDEERRDSISVLGCQGLPVAVMVVKGHRDRSQRGGGGGGGVTSQTLKKMYSFFSWSCITFQ